jgi:Zn-dependent M28 family amino/carboxypeptidase
LLDDHEPFVEAGIPAVDLIDFTYGSKPGLNDYWHTEQDTLDKISPQSLEIVGRTSLRLLDSLAKTGTSR